MPPGLIIATTLLQALAFVLLLLKLSRAGLATKYKGFTIFLAFELVRISVAALIPRHSNSYAWFYLLTQPALWLLYALVTLEVYQSVFRSFSGISRFSRYVILAATAVAVAVSTSSLLLRSEAASRFPVIELYLTLERAMFLSLLAFVLVLVAFLQWYPVPVHTNAIAYSGVFAVFFGVKTGVLVLRTVGGQDFSLMASLASILASIVSCALWIGLLSSAGETRRARSGRGMPEERAELLVAHLKSIDAALRPAPSRRYGAIVGE